MSKSSRLKRCNCIVTALHDTKNLAWIGSHLTSYLACRSQIFVLGGWLLKDSKRAAGECQHYHCKRVSARELQGGVLSPNLSFYTDSRYLKARRDICNAGLSFTNNGITWQAILWVPSITGLEERNAGVWTDFCYNLIECDKVEHNLGTETHYAT